MYPPLRLALAALLVLAGCRGSQPQDRPVAPGTARAAAPPAEAGLRAQVEAGRQLFQASCSGCHSEAPPPRSAPPMQHVAMRYRAAVADREEAVTRIAAYVRAPAAERSLLPGAVRRWGVMPPMPLPEEQLRAVAAYVWTLGDAGVRQGMMRGNRPR